MFEEEIRVMLARIDERVKALRDEDMPRIYGCLSSIDSQTEEHESRISKLEGRGTIFLALIGSGGIAGILKAIGVY